MHEALCHLLPQIDVCLDTLAERLHGGGVRIDGLCVQARGGGRHEREQDGERELEARTNHVHIMPGGTAEG